MSEATLPAPAAAVPASAAEGAPGRGLAGLFRWRGPLRHTNTLPTGLLRTPDTELLTAARVVSLAAPVAFGRLDEIHLRGHLVLRAKDLGILDELIGEAVRSAALAIGRAKGVPADLAALDDRLRYADDFLQRREGEIARRRYAGGLLLGVGISLVALAAIYVIAIGVITLWLGSASISQIPPEQIDALRDMLVAVGGGAAGACVSVLLRLHRVQTLTIEAAFGGAAQYRIYLGWFFAAAVVFLLKSGMLSAVIVIPDPAAGPSERVASWFFWGAVGFLAGFNERWATNLISRGPGDSILGGADSPQSRPSTPEQ